MSSPSSSTPSSSASASVQSLVRQHSYTHAFPSQRSSVSLDSTKERNGLSPATMALAKQVLNPIEATQDRNCSDRTALFFGGLQWLLDATIENNSQARAVSEMDESRKPSLTEDAVRTFNVMDKTTSRVYELKDGDGSGRRDNNRTNAWLSQQVGSE